MLERVIISYEHPANFHCHVRKHRATAVVRKQRSFIAETIARSTHGFPPSNNITREHQLKSFKHGLSSTRTRTKASVLLSVGSEEKKKERREMESEKEGISQDCSTLLSSFLSVSFSFSVSLMDNSRAERSPIRDARYFNSCRSTDRLSLFSEPASFANIVFALKMRRK